MRRHHARLRPGVVAVSLLCALALPAAGRAQEQDPEVPPDPEPPAPVVSGERSGLEVNRVLVPATLNGVLSRGIGVEATCSADCLFTATVRLSRAIASKLGLRKRRLGTRSAEALAGQPRLVRVRFSPAAREAFEDYTGGGRFQIQVSASP